jgi:hypothetical protein
MLASRFAAVNQFCTGGIAQKLAVDQPIVKNNIGLLQASGSFIVIRSGSPGPASTKNLPRWVCCFILSIGLTQAPVTPIQDLFDSPALVPRR